MSQSYTFIDVEGNQAQYTVFDEDQNNEFRWSTQHGDHGVSRSFKEAQDQARAVLKVSMEANRRRSDEAARMNVYSFDRR